MVCSLKVESNQAKSNHFLANILGGCRVDVARGDVWLVWSGLSGEGLVLVLTLLAKVAVIVFLVELLCC